MTATASHIHVVTIDDTYSYQFDNGQVRIFESGTSILNGFFAYSKMVIAAACEIEEQHLAAQRLVDRLNGHSIFIEPPSVTAENEVFLEGRKYTLHISKDQHSASIARYDEQPQLADHEGFFLALATSLSEARQITAYYASELISSGIGLGGVELYEH